MDNIPKSWNCAVGDYHSPYASRKSLILKPIHEHHPCACVLNFVDYCLAASRISDISSNQVVISSVANLTHCSNSFSKKRRATNQGSSFWCFGDWQRAQSTKNFAITVLQQWVLPWAPPPSWSTRGRSALCISPTGTLKKTEPHMQESCCWSYSWFRAGCKTK